MEEEVIIIIKPKRAAVHQAEVHTFGTPEEAYLFLGERNDRKPDKE